MLKVSGLNKQSKYNLIDVKLSGIANDLNVRSKSSGIHDIKTEHPSVIVSVLSFRVIPCVVEIFHQLCETHLIHFTVTVIL